MALSIGDYALIGDCESAGLVGCDGSIDWLCWPRFDSEACFAALLGSSDNGRWLIGPRDATERVTRRYLPNTLILETTFETAEGALKLIDFMPTGHETCDVVRIVTGLRGNVPMKFELILRFGYGASVPWVTRLENGLLRAISGPDMVVLQSSIPVRGENLTSVAEFSLAAGETQSFVLSYAPSHHTPPAAPDPAAALDETITFWTGWVGRCQPSDAYGPAIIRSLITLKALTYAPTGGLVAAPTTSLPERIGGERNWDYRYCWLRDATLTLLAFMNAGYFDEANAWRDWLHRAIAGSPAQAQVIYGVGGERRLVEWEATWLDGYEGSRPVRIGNAAFSQLQLDVYGELMDAFHQARVGGIASTEVSWALQCAFMDHLAQIWREPDEGIWEVRTERRHFTYSKAMAWVAFDRSIRSAEMFTLPAPLETWKAIRAEIHADVCRKGFSRETGTFVQCYGGTELDASLLLLPVIGFLPPEDRRYRATVDAIEKRLLVDGFVLRYDTAIVRDGLPAEEGAFLACSFWLVDAYLLLGRRADAEALFDRLVGLCNDVGLLSEEYDPYARRLVGNFPQAFSHLALVNSAFNLSRINDPAEQRTKKAYGCAAEIGAAVG